MDLLALVLATSAARTGCLDLTPLPTCVNGIRAERDTAKDGRSWSSPLTGCSPTHVQTSGFTTGSAAAAIPRTCSPERVVSSCTAVVPSATGRPWAILINGREGRVVGQGYLDAVQDAAHDLAAHASLRVVRAPLAQDVDQPAGPEELHFLRSFSSAARGRSAEITANPLLSLDLIGGLDGT